MSDFLVFHKSTATYEVKGKKYNSLAEAEQEAKRIAEEKKECLIYKNGEAFSYIRFTDGHFEVRKIKINN